MSLENFKGPKNPSEWWGKYLMEHRGTTRDELKNTNPKMWRELLRNDELQFVPGPGEKLQIQVEVATNNADFERHAKGYQTSRVVRKKNLEEARPEGFLTVAEIRDLVELLIELVNMEKKVHITFPALAAYIKNIAKDPGFHDETKQINRNVVFYSPRFVQTIIRGFMNRGRHRLTPSEQDLVNTLAAKRLVSPSQ